MKLSAFNLLGLCFLIIFFALLQWQVKILKTNQYYKTVYERVLVNAVEDAASQMRRSSKRYGNESLLIQEINVEDTVTSFFSSLFYQLNAKTPEKKEELKQLVPFIIIFDHDGYYVNVLDHVQKKVDSIQTRITLPKRPYAIVRSGVVYTINLAGHITAYIREGNSQRIVAGDYEELLMLKEVPDLEWLTTIESEFDLRRIVYENIAMELEMHIFNHTKIMESNGLDYAIEFDLTKINDVDNLMRSGIYAMVQGLKGVGGQTINLNAFTRTSVDKNHYIIAYRDNMKKTYCISSCYRYENLEIQQVFNNAKEAAKQGFFPCEVCFSRGE